MAQHVTNALRKAIVSLLGLALALTCSLTLIPLTPTSAHAAEADKTTKTEGPTLTEAQAAAIIDARGSVLWSLKPTEEMGLASVTKVMCAMVALDSGLDLDTPHTLVGFDTGAYSQEAGYVEGDTATLRQLLQVLLVFSANDAAEEIATICAGSEQAFVERMNEKAAALGMTHTHFVNPHGLEEEGHYSSVLDMVAMGRFALTNYPLIAETVQKDSVSITAGGVTFSVDSTDDLVKSGYEGILGIKTGSIESGTTFLGAAERAGIRVYTAVLGCKTSEGRFNDTRALMDWVWKNFASRSFATAGTIVGWQTYADNFSFKCPIYVQESASGLVNTAGESLTWHRTSPGCSLVSPGQVTSATNWEQDGRQICTYYTTAGLPIYGVSSFSPLMTSLFEPVPSTMAEVA